MRGRGESSRNGFSPGGAQFRVVADQRPVPAGHRPVLLVHPLAHVDAVRDAVAVGDHQRRPVVGLRLAQRPQGLLRVGAHRHPRHVHVAVGDRLQRQVLLGHGLAGRGELGDRAERRRLGRLPAGVGVHLGVEHQHVHVTPAGQHVIQPAGADVVGPAVAADQPHAAPDQVVERRFAGPQRGAVVGAESRPAAGSARPPGARCAANSDSRRCGAARMFVHQVRPDRLAQLGQPRPGQPQMQVGGEPEAQPELGVVLEQ